jgi:hypothetical protein
MKNFREVKVIKMEYSIFILVIPLCSVNYTYFIFTINTANFVALYYITLRKRVSHINVRLHTFI